jgi:hypothetical protein
MNENIRLVKEKEIVNIQNKIEEKRKLFELNNKKLINSLDSEIEKLKNNLILLTLKWADFPNPIDQIIVNQISDEKSPIQKDFHIQETPLYKRKRNSKQLSPSNNSNEKS